METVELKKTVLDYVNHADKRLLNVIKAVVESYNRSEIVAYDVENNPLSRDEYNNQLIVAEREIDRGEYIRQKDLEEESENW